MIHSGVRNIIKYEKLICMMLIIFMIAGFFPSAVNSVYADSGEPEEQQEYIIYLNGMGVTVIPSSITVTSGGIYSDLPDLYKEHYNFKGWYTDPYEGEEIKSGDEVREPVPQYLYARWEGVGITITLDPCRAVLKQAKYTVYYGDSYKVLPTPSRKGLVFMGWYTKKSGGKKINIKNKITVEKNITLYAKWAPIWYLQTDKKWKKKWYRVRKENSTIGNAGCGPTSMAMVVASLKNTGVTPVTACKWSKKKKYKAYCSGTKDGFFKAFGKKYGIKVKQTSYGDYRYIKKSKSKKYHNQAKKAVKNGKWVIALVGKGKWTRGSGHFILWYKVEGDYALIRDSNSTSSGRAKAKVSTLQKQVKRYWIINVPESRKVN